VDTSGGPGSVTVTWEGLSPALSGTVKLGEVLLSVPATATDGQSYAVQVTAASGSLGATTVPLVKGPNVLLTITTVNPAPTVASLSPSSGALGGAAFTLTVNGTNFVIGSVVRWNGADRATTFTSSTQLTAAIPASDLAATGVAMVTVFNPAPGGGESSALPFTISVPNPVPTISSLVPSTATAGGATFNLTVNGTGFFTGSVVQWNGADRPAAYVSATQLIAPISAGDIMAAGTAQITVFNPAPGGGTSNALAFAINLAATPAAIVKASGDNQSAGAGTALASPLVVQVNSAAGSGVPGVVVNFEVTPQSGATLSTLTAVTNSAGQAQVNVTLGTSPGTVTVSASVVGVATAAVFTATATAREPAALAIVSGNNQTAAADSALADALVVKVTDQYANPVSGITVNFAVTGGAASLSAPTATTGSDGQAQVNATLGTTPGTVTMAASVTGVAAPVTFTATATVGLPVPPIIVSGNNQPAAVNSPLSEPLVVKVADQYGNPLAGVAVTFAITAGSGTLSATTAVTNSSGQAQVSLTLGTTAGTVTVTATIAGVASPAVFSATATPGPPAALTVVSGNNQTGIAGSVLANPLVVKLADQYGNPVAGITVLFAVASGAGSLSASSVVTGGDGRAQVTWRLGAVGVEHAVHASAGTLPALEFTATAITGPPAALAIVSGNNQTGLAGSTLLNPLVVRVTDQYGNAVPGAAVGFAVTAGNGSVNPPSATTDASGLAQAQWTLGAVAGVNTAQATLGTLLPVSFAASGAAPQTAQGAVAALAAQGSPGGIARVPVVLTLNNGIAANSVSFGIRILPVGTAMALTDPLDFEKDAGMPEPSLKDTSFGVNAISVSWLVLANSLTGTVRLGEVLVPIPSLAADGQTYTVRVTGAGGAAGDTDVTLAVGADALLSVSGLSYLVGDTYPLLTDKNADNDTDDAGEFGNEALSIVDLIYALRAVTGITGWRPPTCSDRFDAIDAYPVDTPTVRGGDAKLSILDLIITLRRVTGVDTSSPRRYSRNQVCPAGAGFTPMRVTTPIERPETQAVGLELGAAVKDELGRVRIPLYLVARGEATLAGVGFAVGLEGESRVRPIRARLRFVPNDAFQPPSLVDDDLPGVLALAWLEGFRIAAGQRLLLGWVDAPGAAPALHILGFDAPTEDGARTRGEIQ
jgi:hypothetical protein